MSLDKPMNRRLASLALLLGGSLVLGGCFTPLYGTSTDGTRSASRVDQLRQIDVGPIPGRGGIIMRNEIVFGLTGGAGTSGSPTHKLNVLYSVSGTPIFVDAQSSRPTAQTINVTATYTLIDLETNKPVHSGSAFASASLDRSQQRLASERAVIEAEERASKATADQVVTNLAAWFATRSR